VFENGKYTIVVSEPDLDKVETIVSVQSIKTKGSKAITVKL